MDELIETKLIWHDEKKEKPKIDEQVLIRIESYHKNSYNKENLRGRGFRIGYWQRDPRGHESWYYLGKLEESAKKMNYVWEATYWTYLPENIDIKIRINEINNRFEILDIR